MMITKPFSAITTLLRPPFSEKPIFYEITKRIMVRIANKVTIRNIGSSTPQTWAIPIGSKTVVWFATKPPAKYFFHVFTFSQPIYKLPNKGNPPDRCAPADFFVNR